MGKIKVIFLDVDGVLNSDRTARRTQSGYASQDDPQLLMEEYLPIKNFELLYGWWKQHYKATLKDCDNP